MYFSDDLNEDNIESRIREHEEKLVKLRALKDKVSKMEFYECGIRKSDHRLCYFKFVLGGSVDAAVEVNIPSHNENYKTTLEDFEKNYVPYSKKTRAILPKRNKK